MEGGEIDAEQDWEITIEDEAETRGEELQVKKAEQNRQKSERKN